MIYGLSYDPLVKQMAAGEVVSLAYSTDDRESFPLYPGWRVLVAAVVGLAFSPGPMVFGSFGLLAPHLQQRFGWTLGQIMLTLTLFNLGSVLAAPYTGRLIDRFGVRKILFPSLAAFLCGFVTLAYAVASLGALYLLALVWGASTVGTQSISYTKLLTVWFKHRRGLAVGIAAAGLGLGYSIVPLLVAALLGKLDWRGTLAVLAVLLAVVPTSLNAAFAHARAPALRNPQDEPPGLSLAQARSTASFWLIAGAIFLASMALTGVVPHLPLLARERGFTVTEAAEVASAFGVSTIVGRVLVGALADRFFLPTVAMCFFGVSALGFLGAALLGSHASLALLSLTALAIGFGFGAESDVIALLISRYFGQRSFGAIYGVLLAAFLIGASAGPPLLGFGHDRLGRYPPLMLVAAGVMVCAVALLAGLDRNVPHLSGSEPDEQPRN